MNLNVYLKNVHELVEQETISKIRNIVAHDFVSASYFYVLKQLSFSDFCKFKFHS